jgi:tRNA-specific 2-thiouridylase
MKEKVILGISGGVDSSVALIKLLEQGYDVECMFMRNWDSNLNNDILGNPNDLNDVCPQEKDYMDSVNICNKLNVKLHRVDFIDEYWENVFQYFLKEYEKGRTPNPDIFCNKEIKFKAFLEKAMDLNCDYIAMGHYARVEYIDGVKRLLKGVDENKDQTYFLCQLSQAQIDKSLFPIGDIKKPEVREIARKYDLITKDKKDSTGICFIGERNFRKFLSNYLPAKQGELKTLDGKVVGHHDGAMYYTIGQRKGLNIGGMKEFDNDAWYVVSKDVKNNVVYVEQGFHHPYLYSNKCIIKDINYLGEKFEGSKEFNCKFRYRQPDIKTKITFINDNEAIVEYDNVRAVTPGQACAIYSGDICLGGGIIDKVFMNDEERKY